MGKKGSLDCHVHSHVASSIIVVRSLHRLNASSAHQHPKCHQHKLAISVFFRANATNPKKQYLLKCNINQPIREHNFQ
eukprot:3749928-Amphidinium_carterae.1